MGMKPTRDTFSENLFKARKALNIKQDEAASIIGVARTTYSRWETGLNQPRFEDLDKICLALKTTPGELFDDGSLPKQELTLYETFERLGNFLNFDVKSAKAASNVPEHIRNSLTKVTNFTAIESALNATLKAEGKSIDKSKKDVG